MPNENYKIRNALYKACVSFCLEHKCGFPGCKNVLVLDGNMKNRRDVCFAKDAGSIHYPGLPEQIKTGCVASPSFKSRFCHKHDVHSCSATSPTELEGEGKTLHDAITPSVICTIMVS